MVIYIWWEEAFLVGIFFFREDGISPNENFVSDTLAKIRLINWEGPLGLLWKKIVLAVFQSTESSFPPTHPSYLSTPPCVSLSAGPMSQHSWWLQLFSPKLPTFLGIWYMFICLYTCLNPVRIYNIYIYIYVNVYIYIVYICIYIDTLAIKNCFPPSFSFFSLALCLPCPTFTLFIQNCNIFVIM